MSVEKISIMLWQKDVDDELEVGYKHISSIDAGWSSLVARRAHNPKVEGSNPSPATKQNQGLTAM